MSKNMSRRDFLRMGAAASSSAMLAKLGLSARSLALPLRQDGPVAIKYWRHSTPSGEKVTNMLLEKFKTAAPDINVTVEYLPDTEFEERLRVAVGTGEIADVYQLNNSLFEQFLRRDLFAPVDFTVFGYESQEQMLSERFIPGSMDVAIKDGVLYAGGMPEFGTWAIAYNKAGFDRVGLPYPSETEPMTWEQYFELAAQLTVRENGRMVQMGDGIWLTAQDNIAGCSIILDPIFKQHGGDAFDPETGKPTNREVWEKVAQLMYDCSLNGKYSYVDMGFPTSTNAHPEMFSGRVAMLSAGIWAEGWGKTVNPDLQIGFAPLPQVDSDNNAVFFAYWAWVVNAATSIEKQVAGWRLIEFLTNDENVKVFFDEAGELQPRNVEGFAEYVVEKSPGQKVFIQDAPRGTRPVYGDKGAERWEVVRKMAEAIFKAGQTAETAVAAAWDEMESLP